MESRMRYVLLIVAVLTVVGSLFWLSRGTAHAPAGTSAGATETASAAAALATTSPPLFDYIELADSCNIHYAGSPCVLARSAPTTTAPVVGQLRTGIVLQVAATTTEADGRAWYHVLFDTPMLYPERVTSPWYVAADLVSPFTDPGLEELPAGHWTPATLGTTTAPTDKRIVVDRAKEMLYAYEGSTLFIQSPVSTGLDLTPTPLGSFIVYRKSPTSYMQGPLPGISDQYYDLPGVPWDLYFTLEGGAIHGAYWHNAFGQEWSHGCVNLPLDTAKKLYYWAPLGTPVSVID